MSLDQRCILGVVTIDAKRWRILCQVEIKFAFSALASLVRHMAGIAPHVQGCMTTAILRDVDSHLVAAEAKIRILTVSIGGLEQLVLIVGRMWIVTLRAIAHCRRVDLPVDISSFFVGVAGNAESNRGGGDEFRAGNIFIYPDLMTASTAHRNRRMD
jgi:hypothetical protein